MIDAELLANTDDPWAYLREVENGNLDERYPHLSRWVDLVARRPILEQDSLLDRGKEVFRFKMGTIQKALKERPGPVRAQQFSLGVQTPEFIAEAFLRPGAGGKAPTVGYLVYTYETGAVTEQDTVEVDGITWVPPVAKATEGNVVRLPSGVEEYGSTGDLFVELKNHISHYIELEDETFKALCATYTMMTWVYDRFPSIPYLRVTGDFGGGKTRCIHAVGACCYRPIILTGSTTPSPAFRVIDQYRGTLVLDEADFGKSDMENLFLKVLNGGYERGFPILRAEKDGDGSFGFKPFSAFGPKVLSTRHAFADAALESRCFTYTMPLIRMNGQPLILDETFYDRALRLRNKLVLWRFRMWHTIKVDPYEYLSGVEPRVNQIALPLLACLPDHPRLRSSLISSLQRYSQAVREERVLSWEGTVLNVLYQAWTRNLERPRSVLIKDLVPEVRQDFPHTTNRAVASTLRRVFKFVTTVAGGPTRVLVDPVTMEAVAKRYGIVPREEAPRG